MADSAVAEGGLIAGLIGLGVAAFGLVLGAVQKRRKGKGGPVGSGVVPEKAAEVDCDFHGMPESDVQAVYAGLENGEPSSFLCCGSDRLLFQARLRSFSTYALSRNGALKVIGWRQSPEGSFMVLTMGAGEEHERLSREGRVGGELDRIAQEILSPAERSACRPVAGYSNFAVPGCELISLDGFNRCVAEFRSAGSERVATALTGDETPQPGPDSPTENHG